MTKGSYAVTGATGHVGKVVVEKLESQGHQVRRIARSVGVDLNDGPALARAFEGADGAFLLIPPEYRPPTCARGRTTSAPSYLRLSRQPNYGV